jgi:hypothetical protein
VTPAEFLALIRAGSSPAKAPPSARAYSALKKGEAAETLLTMHTRAGNVEALPYGALQLASGDEAGGTLIRLIFPKVAAIIHGKQLAAVFEAIRTRTAAHLYEFVAERYDEPELGEPVITEFAFEVEAKLPRTPP